MSTNIYVKGDVYVVGTPKKEEPKQRDADEVDFIKSILKSRLSTDQKNSLLNNFNIRLKDKKADRFYGYITN